MNKKLIENIIINKYSIINILKEFEQINNITDGLFKCSNGDFKFLNKIFKEYFKKTKEISDSAQNLFNIINKKKITLDVEKQLEDYLNKLKNYNIIFEKVINSLINLTEEIDRNIKLSKLSKENLYQNNKLLRLVFNNIDYVGIFKEKEKEVKDKIPKLFKIINENINNYEENYKYLIENIKEIKERLNIIKESHIKQINLILNNIEKSKELLSKKNQIASKKYPDLYNLIVDNTKNKDKIITNLQYHDIIRQRMEHVQNAYKDVINILKENKNQTNKEFTNNIIKIKDISKIQISQLNHASKDYKIAIEEITDSLLNLSENSINLFEMCNAFSDNSENKNENCFEKINLELKSTIKLKAKLIKNNIEIDSYYYKIKNIINDYICSYSNLEKEIKKLFCIEKYLTGEDLKLTKLHLKLILNEIKQSLTNMNNSTSLIKNNFEKTKKSVYNLISEEIIENELKNLNENGFELLSKVKQCEEKLKYIIDNNKKYYGNLSDNILKDIKNIQYYNIYNKNIKKINKIHQDNFSIIETETNLENLNDLESDYTMKSERDVLHNNDNKDVGNNIELF